MVSYKHKVFIGYYHDANQAYSDKIRYLYAAKAIIDKSM